MASKILFTAGAKGGTGKSTALRYIIDWLQDAGIEPLLIDADDENSTMSRFFPQALKVEPRRTKSYDVIMNLAERGEHPLMIVDLKAGVGYEMLNWFGDVPFEELKSIGVSMVCIGVITSSPDSVSSVLRWVDFLGKQVQYLIVKNLKDSDASRIGAESVAFPEYDQTKQALEFRKRYKPAEILMRGLDPEYQGELERVNMTIRDVLARRPDAPELLTPLIVRAKLRNYQAALFEQFAAHKNLLLP
jgi:MinD-like ATPase involved in chromosome partitioning or flagellar assembly